MPALKTFGDRSTVCKAMISKIKRMLKILEALESQAHSEKLLAEKVFAEMFRDMKDIEGGCLFDIPRRKYHAERIKVGAWY